MHHTNTRVRMHIGIIFIHMCLLNASHQYACTHVLRNNLHTHVFSEYITRIREYPTTLKYSSYTCVDWIQHTNTHVHMYYEIIFIPMCCPNASHKYACTRALWNNLHTHLLCVYITRIRVYATTLKQSSYPCVFWIHCTNTRVRNSSHKYSSYTCVDWIQHMSTHVRMYSEIIFIPMCCPNASHKYTCTHALWNNLQHMCWLNASH